MPRTNPAGPQPRKPRVKARATPELYAVPDVCEKPLTPLEYMLAVMNDPDADVARRDRMAACAAPYIHPRIEKVVLGKKVAQAEAADDAATDIYAVPPPPGELETIQ